MRKWLKVVNHLPSADLNRPFGRRVQGFLIAVGLVMAMAAMSQMHVQAQEQEAITADCVGQYIEAIRTYVNEMLLSLEQVRNAFAWYDPMRTLLVDAIGLKYQARVQSATFQLIACTAAPVFKG